MQRLAVASPVRAFVPRHPDQPSAGRMRASLIAAGLRPAYAEASAGMPGSLPRSPVPIEQGGDFALPLHPHRPTLRGLDAANVSVVGSRPGRFPLAPEPHRAESAALGDPSFPEQQQSEPQHFSSWRRHRAVLLVPVMFSSFSRRVPHFGLWAEDAYAHEDRAAALAILRRAADVCDEQDMRTPEVFEALAALEARATRRGAFRQLRAALSYPNPQARQEAVRSALAAIERVLGLSR